MVFLMLLIKPNCEYCDKDLTADATDAMICSFECTFCRECVDTILNNVCPNCGGGFCQRPIRPKTPYRAGVSTQHQLPSSERVNTCYTEFEIRSFSQKIKDIAPERR